MAQPARKPSPAQTPPLDPHAVERAYRLERAKRRARIERTRAKRLAGLRFGVVTLALIVLTIVLTLTIWQQVQRLFGL